MKIIPPRWPEFQIQFLSEVAKMFPFSRKISFPLFSSIPGRNSFDFVIVLNARKKGKKLTFVEKEDYDDACDDDDETMQIKIHMMMQMMMTGVTISRQDPGATQAQEASRCASTLNKSNLHYFNQIHHRQIRFAFIKLKFNHKRLINIKFKQP